MKIVITEKKAFLLKKISKTMQFTGDLLVGKYKGKQKTVGWASLRLHSLKKKKNPPTMQEPQEKRVQSLGQEDPPGVGRGKYSCLENPIDRGTWWAIVHRVAKTQT